MANSEQNRLHGIDALRGIAACVVMLSHYFPYWNRNLSEISVIVPGQFGYYAVYLFFVISGFVIFATIQRCKTVRQFLFLRFSRLYPAYWASLLLMTVLLWALFNKQFWPAALLLNATMFQEFFGFPNIDEVFWSLTVELSFYFQIACLIRMRLVKYAVAYCLVWLGTACLWGIFWAPTELFPRSYFAMFLAPEYAHFFVIGVAFYLCRKDGFSKPVAALFISSIFTAYVVGGLQTLLVTMSIIGIVGVSLFRELRVLRLRIFIWLGQISFSLYLVHRNLGYELLPKLHAQGMGPVESIAIAISCSLLLASIITFAVEQPALSYLRSRYYSRVPK